MLAEIRNQLAHSQTTNVYVRNSEKIDFIRELLTERGGEMAKVELLEAARTQWVGRNVSQQFLDRAIEDECVARKESNATITVLLKGGATDYGHVTSPHRIAPLRARESCSGELPGKDFQNASETSRSGSDRCQTS